MNDDLQHGGALDAMQRMFPQAPTPWLDLSTGINPFSYQVRIANVDSARHLPTRESYRRCQNDMAEALLAPQQYLLLAPGSELLIRLLPTVIRPKSIAILERSYGDHSRVWQAEGCDVVEHRDPLELADRVNAVVVCNPNNPDGRSFGREALETARSALADRGGWLIIDEAYADLDPALSLAPVGGSPGLIILRSFGKFFGLAGLRLAGLLAPQELIDAMSQRLGVWPVSGPALEAGVQAYADLEWQRATRERLARTRQRLDEILANAGFHNVTGTDLFALVHTNGAMGLWQRLAEQGIYVRRFAWSDEHVRIGLPQNREAEDRLERALQIVTEPPCSSE